MLQVGKNQKYWWCWIIILISSGMWFYGQLVHLNENKGLSIFKIYVAAL